MYRECSTSEEEAVDDPRPSSSATVGFKGKLKAGDHIIYEQEGQQFPAMIEKDLKRWLVVKKMTPLFRSGYAPLWEYEGQLIKKMVYPKEVLHRIPAPALQATSSGRLDNQYYVEKMGEYWLAAQGC